MLPRGALASAPLTLTPRRNPVRDLIPLPSYTTIDNRPRQTPLDDGLPLVPQSSSRRLLQARAVGGRGHGGERRRGEGQGWCPRGRGRSGRRWRLGPPGAELTHRRPFAALSLAAGGSCVREARHMRRPFAANLSLCGVFACSYLDARLRFGRTACRPTSSPRDARLERHDRRSPHPTRGGRPPPPSGVGGPVPAGPMPNNPPRFRWCCACPCACPCCMPNSPMPCCCCW